MRFLILCLSAALSGSTATAQMNQVDNQAGLFSPTTISALQLFEPPSAQFNCAAMDDFTAPGTIAFTQVRCAFEFGNVSTPVTAIQGWRVTIWRTFFGATYSNDQFNGEFGPALAIHWPVSSVFVSAAYAPAGAVPNGYIATMNMPGLLLPQGTYILTAVPRMDFVPHGQVFVLGNSNPVQCPSANNGFWVNPGQGFGGPPPPAWTQMNVNVALSIQ